MVSLLSYLPGLLWSVSSVMTLFEPPVPKEKKNKTQDFPLRGLPADSKCSKCYYYSPSTHSLIENIGNKGVLSLSRIGVSKRKELEIERNSLLRKGYPCRNRSKVVPCGMRVYE